MRRHATRRPSAASQAVRESRHDDRDSRSRQRALLRDERRQRLALVADGELQRVARRQLAGQPASAAMTVAIFG